MENGKSKFKLTLIDENQNWQISEMSNNGI